MQAVESRVQAIQRAAPERTVPESDARFHHLHEETQRQQAKVEELETRQQAKIEELETRWRLDSKLAAARTEALEGAVLRMRTASTTSQDWSPCGNLAGANLGTLTARCRKCGECTSLLKPSPWKRWTCDACSNQFTEPAQAFGCPTAKRCDWCLCKECFESSGGALYAGVA